MFNRRGRQRMERVGLKILYRNPRRPGEAGVKLIPDQSQRAAEKEILKGLGFTIIEITPAPLARAPAPVRHFPNTSG
jgi:hypothetical protein